MENKAKKEKELKFKAYQHHFEATKKGESWKVLNYGETMHILIDGCFYINVCHYILG